MLYLGPWAGMLKSYCHICNKHPPFFLIAKFHAKIRILKFGPKMPYCGVLGSNFEKPFSYLKSALSNLPYQCSPICLMTTFPAKIRFLKFGTKNALFRCFGQPFSKTIVILEISSLEFV